MQVEGALLTGIAGSSRAQAPQLHLASQDDGISITCIPVHGAHRLKIISCAAGSCASAAANARAASGRS